MVLKKKSIGKSSNAEIIKNSLDIDINHQYLVDTQKKINIYIDPFALQLEMELSEVALKLLRYIEKTLQWNQDYFKMYGKKSDNFMAMANIKSKTTMVKAVAQLCESGFITKDIKRGFYWINPFRLFHGNRKEKYPEYIKIINK